MATNNNRLDKLEQRIQPGKVKDDCPIILHQDGQTRQITPEERKKIKGKFIRVIEHEKNGSV